MKRLPSVVAAALSVFSLSPLNVAAWNIPTHMVSGSIAYQILARESPATITKVRAVLKKHPWYETRWRYEIEKLPESQRDEMLFMMAARWADDFRMEARLQREVVWHFINWPFKPDGEPESVKPLPPRPDNILSAFDENQRRLRSPAQPDKRATALAWLFHLVDDLHQPLHTIQLFTREYPNGDRGGNEVCIRVGLNQAPLNLHALWDSVITSSTSVDRLRKIATELLNRFSASSFRELDHTEPEAWAKESYEIAVKIAYENGSLRGTPKSAARDCRDVNAVTYLSRGYPARARLIADRRIYLAGYRLADLLRTVEQ